MILMHVAYGLDLIALALGGGLLSLSMRTAAAGSMVGKIIGTAVIVLSIVSMVCIYSCAMRGECHKPPMGGPGGMGAPMVDQANSETAVPDQGTPAPGKKGHR